MTKNKDKLHILVEKDNKYYLLMEIIIESDNSIYFMFPNKDRLKYNSELVKKYYKGDFLESKNTLNETSKKYEDPRITFHPGKMIVHINSNVLKVKKDFEVLNIDPEGGIFCNLLQAVFAANLDFFDIYRRKIDDNCLILNKNEFPNSELLSVDEKNISFEVIVHSSQYTPSLPECLPKAKRDFKYLAIFNTNKSLTISIAVSNLCSKSEFEKDEILVLLNTLEKCVMFTLTK